MSEITLTRRAREFGRRNRWPVARPIIFGSADANAIVAAEPELLPCPFCGGQPEFVPPTVRDGVDCAIYCPDCQVYAERGRRCDVVDHWNTRWKGGK